MAKGDYITWTEGTPLIGVSSADSGTGTEAASLHAALSDTDTGSGAEVALSIGVRPGGDAGAFLDALAALAVQAADTGTGTDALASLGVRPSGDAGAFLDTAVVGVAGTDSSAFAEAALIGVTGTDTGTGTDAGAPPNASLSDSDAMTAEEHASGPALVVVFGAPLVVQVRARAPEVDVFPVAQ